MGNEMSPRESSKSSKHKGASIFLCAQTYDEQDESQWTAPVNNKPDSLHCTPDTDTLSAIHSDLPSISTVSSFSSSVPLTSHYKATCTPNLSPITSNTSLSKRIVKVAAAFWVKHIDTLSGDRQLEIGCSLFFGMMSMKPEMKPLLTAKQKKAKIESISIKYLDMFGWLLRFLLTQHTHDDTLIDPVHPLLLRLGQLHTAMGIKLQHFGVMLSSLHETFAYYFPKAYTIQVQYAVDVIFTTAAKIMSGQALNSESYFREVTKNSPRQESIKFNFLDSLEKCLQSPMGREYFYKYLQQQCNDEIVVYLQLLAKFKAQHNDTQRFFVAREMTRACIVTDSWHSINISYECRKSTLNAMKDAEAAFAVKQPRQISVDFFENVEMEMRRLIIKNHWNRFRRNTHIFTM